MAKYLKNKKGSIEDGIFLVVILFGLAVGAIAFTYTYNQFYGHVQNVTAFNSSDSAMAAFDAGNTINSMWDYVIFFVLLGFTISIIIIGYFVDVHTIFFPLFVIGMLVGVVVCIVIEYAWDTIADNIIFGTLRTTSFPLTDHILSNMVIYYVIVMALSMLAIYGKSRAQK